MNKFIVFLQGCKAPKYHSPNQQPAAIQQSQPHSLFINLINKQKEKEDEQDIWKNSPYKHLIKLQLNNVGIVGETYIQKLCDLCDITANINGCKTKKIGGGTGDGLINNKTVEIKTSHQGCKTPNFQHELGERPWNAEYMVFLDISPHCIFLTIFKNFTENEYKSENKCIPYFPTKTITWRKKSGAFKLDTTIKINEENIEKGYTIKIQENAENIQEIKNFIEMHIILLPNNY